MTVIGIVGLPGSGKSEAAAVAREEGVPVVTMGDVVRQECRDRGLDPAEDHGAVAVALREENGEDAIAQRSLPIIDDHLAGPGTDTVLVDGLRAGVEAERFAEAYGDDFLLLAVEAPFDVREKRVTDRGRDNTGDGGESLADRDERERGFGMDDAIAMADVTVENTDSLDAFHDRVRALLQEGPQALAEDPAVHRHTEDEGEAGEGGEPA